MILTANLLCKADCFDFLERLDAEVAMLVYLDPPFFTSNSQYFLFETESKTKLTVAQKKEREDKAFNNYLSWLSKIIQQAKRITSQKGSVVIHTEPRLNSYARIIAERIFDKDNLSEIVLRRPLRIGNSSFPRDEHESLLICRLSRNSLYNQPFRPSTKEEIKNRFNHEDEFGQFSLVDLTTPYVRLSLSFEWNGVKPPLGKSWKFSKEKLLVLDSEGRIYYSPINKRPYLKAYMNESAGIPIGNNWDDLPIRVFGKERTNHVAQQPLAVLERLILTTTNEGDIIIDPFCGSGTSLVAAQRNSRCWIGCDELAESIEITQNRLNEAQRESPKAKIEFQYIQEDELKKYEKKSYEYQFFSSGLAESTDILFVRNQPVRIEETRHYEFKEIKGINPVGSIENASDEYAVAFLNSEGGRIFWGIRNEDRVAVGVFLKFRQRDEISKAVTNKLHHIQPLLTPSSWRIDFHQVYESNKPVPDLFVVELIIPRPPQSNLLFGTGKGEVFIKTDSGKKRLSFTELQAEIIKRQNR